MKPRSYATALLIAAVTVGGASAAAADMLHARVSFDAGGAMVRGADDQAWSHATINTLILPGDTIWADAQSTLEVEMSGGTFLRLADGSKAEIASLPPSAAVKGWTGAFYVQRVARSTGGFLFQTPACTVEVAPDSMARIDIMEAGLVSVTARWGTATIRTDAGGVPMVLTQGLRSYVEPGYLPSDPGPYDVSSEDSFDEWNRERARLLALGEDALPVAAAKTAAAAPIGTADLSYYGDWVTVNSARYWRPTVTVDYVPYRNGYWTYVPAYGHTWIDYQPFGYVTSHYGRWSYFSDYGWCWSYYDGWSPAWALTVRYGPNFVWCPIDRYNRPVSYGSAHFNVGGVLISVFASSYCGADSLLIGPSPVYPCTTTVVSPRYAGHSYVWDINTGSRSAIYRGTTEVIRELGLHTLVRDYSPRRVIRGPDTITPGRTAESRVAALQSSIGRDEFSVVRATGSRGVRTPLANVETRLQGESRSVRVADAAIEQTQENLRRVETRSGASTVTSSPRGRAVAGLGQGESTSTTPIAARITPDANESRTDVRQRGHSAAVAPRSAAPMSEAPQRSPRVTSAPSDAADVSPRTRVPGMDAPQLSSPRAVTTPPRTIAPTSPRVTTTAPRTAAPVSPRATTPRTVAPATPQSIAPRTVAPVSPRATTPRAVAPATPQSIAPRTAAPVSPRATTPRTVAPATPQSIAPRTVTTTPRAITPRTVAPSAPRAVTSSLRVTTPPSRTPSVASIPPRSVSPRVESPSVRVPSAAMTPRSAPSAPAPRAITPRYEAPSRPSVSPRSFSGGMDRSPSISSGRSSSGISRSPSISSGGSGSSFDRSIGSSRSSSPRSRGR